MQLLIKHRYRHTDPETGQRVETRHHMTVEAAAASSMVEPELIAESIEQRYVPDNPNDPQFGPNFAKAPKR